MIKRIFPLFVLLVSFCGYCQLSDLHYLPPLKQQRNGQAISKQTIYLSTPSTSPFTVNVYRGANNFLHTSFIISKTAPIRYNLSNGDNNITLRTNNATGTAIRFGGFRFESPSGKKFYVNYRGRSNGQATSLTFKGRAALGRKFKWGGALIEANHSSMSYGYRK